MDEKPNLRSSLSRKQVLETKRVRDFLSLTTLLLEPISQS